MRRLISSLFVVLATLVAVPTLSAQSREWEDEQLYWMRQERRAIERARYEREQWIAETRYRERVVQKEAERLDRARRDAADYFGGGYAGRIGSGGVRNTYRYGYGSYYDPAYLQQMIRLPDGLAACQIDFSTGRVVSCHSVIKDVMLIEDHARDHADRGELLGTVHPEKGKLHFRSFDDTNRRIGPVEAGLGMGVLGAGATHIATRHMENRGAADAVTMGVGGGIGLLTWWANSRHKHDNCLTIEPMMAQSGGLAVPSDSASAVELAAPAPAVNSAKGGLSLRNESGETAFVYDGNEAVTSLAAGASAPVGRPRTSYRAIVERFNERGEVELYELGRRVEGATLVFTAEAQLLPRAPAETEAR